MTKAKRNRAVTATPAVNASETVNNEVSENELEQIVSRAELYEGQPSEEDIREENTASFKELFEKVTNEEADKVAHAAGSQIDAREAFEKDKSAKTGKDNIFKTLKKAREAMITHAAARVMIAASVDPGFVNGKLHDGSCYNVYAIGKFSDFVKGLAGVKPVGNAINLAVTKSMFRLVDAGVPFTGELARAAASDKIKVENKDAAKLLVRHTVSASTAPTQASSTMAALETLGVVRVSGSRRQPTYDVIDGPVTRKLRDLLLNEQAVEAVNDGDDASEEAVA